MTKFPFLWTVRVFFSGQINKLRRWFLEYSDCCHCGDYVESHNPWYHGHNPVPMTRIRDPFDCHLIRKFVYGNNSYFL